MSETNKIIILVGVVATLVTIAIMFAWEATRRSNVEVNAALTEQHIRAEECIESGNRPDWFGRELECKKN